MTTLYFTLISIAALAIVLELIIRSHLDAVTMFKVKFARDVVCLIAGLVLLITSTDRLFFLGAAITVWCLKTGAEDLAALVATIERERDELPTGATDSRGTNH